MPKADAASTISPPESNTLPVMPPPRVSAYELAAQLPELWQASCAADEKSTGYDKTSPIYRALNDFQAEISARTDALERAALLTPAQNLRDAVAQLLLLSEGLQTTSDVELAERAGALHGALRIILPMCEADFAGLVDVYAKGLDLEMA